MNGASIWYVATAIAAHADIGLLSMARETFEGTKSLAVFADHGRGFVRHNLLIGAGFEEFTYP